MKEDEPIAEGIIELLLSKSESKSCYVVENGRVYTYTRGCKVDRIA